MTGLRSGRKRRGARPPFPSRLPVIALLTKFFSVFADMLERWAAWAEAEVDGWERTGPGEATVPKSAWEPGLPGRPLGSGHGGQPLRSGHAGQPLRSGHAGQRAASATS